MHILHTMNAVYGQASKYSARSRYIVENSGDERTFEVFARGFTQNAGIDPPNRCTKISIPAYYQMLRGVAKVSGKMDSLKKAIWKGFDTALSKKIEGSPVETARILHSWEWIPLTMDALRAKNPGIRIVRDIVVNRYHEYYSGTPVTVENEKCDYFLSPSSFTTAKLVEWGISSEKVVEIPFGVDTDLFRPRQEKPGTPVRFAFSGGVSRRKGVDSLLRVWKRLKLPNAELHLYGKVRSDVKSELGGCSNVVCHGFVSLPEELPGNHVFVFPSTLEGSAKSVYEALACGLPVITTPDSGSIVRHETDGLIVETGSDDDLAEALQKLYSDPALREEYGMRARENARQHTWHHYAQRVRDFYASIAGSGTA